MTKEQLHDLIMEAVCNEHGDFNEGVKRGAEIAIEAVWEAFCEELSDAA